MRQLHQIGVMVIVLLPANALAQAPDADTEVPSSVYKNVRALCIGINNFHKSTELSSFNHSESTARRLHDLFRSDFQYDVTGLFGKDATKDAIEAAINEYEHTLGPDDALVIFISTHGVEVEATTKTWAFLVPSSTKFSETRKSRELDEWFDQAVSMQWIGRRCQDMKARHVLVIVESCHSGWMGQMSGSTLAISHQRLMTENSRAAITGGTPGQEITEGFFGNALCEVLERVVKEQRSMTARELHVLVREKVMDNTNLVMKPQYREMLPDSGEFVFVPRGIPYQKVVAQVEASNLFVAQYMGESIGISDVFAAAEMHDYRFGVHVPTQDRYWKRRVEVFQRHAQVDGNPFAMAALYYCYARGLGTEVDRKRAFDWAQTAYDSGHPVGKFVLARCYHVGIGVTQNRAVADRLTREALNEGSILARSMHAHEYYRRALKGERLSDSERKEMVAGLEAAAEAGSPSARLSLGQLLAEGIAGLPREPSRGISLIRQAAADELPEAQFKLALGYLNGSPGVMEKSLAQYRGMIRAAAENGHGFAQFKLAFELLTGANGFVRDEAEALRWADVSAKQDVPTGHMAMYQIYVDGLGVPVDLPRAIGHLENAVALGHAPAMMIQGDHYLSGTHYLQDEVKGVRLLRRAAEAGIPRACYGLALCLDNAIGIELPGLDRNTPRNEIRLLVKHHALHWYVRAVELGRATGEQQYVDESMTALRNFAGLARLEANRQVPLGLGDSAATIKRRFQQEFPESFATFEELVATKPNG